MHDTSSQRLLLATLTSPPRLILQQAALELLTCCSDVSQSFVSPKEREERKEREELERGFEKSTEQYLASERALEIK